MQRFSHIIFDLDGTITDNTEGIKNAVRFALRQMHLDDNNIVPDEFIGPPLQWGFKSLYGMGDREVKMAVDYFREYYADYGWKENVPYEGIVEAMEQLHSEGKKLYIATSKLEKYALKIVRHFGLDKYIEALSGADYSGLKATKPVIIAGLLETNRVAPSPSVVMVGDTVFDMEGGKENGLSTVAVGYGFGNREELLKAGPDFFVEDVEELYEFLSR